MNPSGISLFNQARIEWAIRLKYSPMPSLDMDILSSQLNAFRIGDFRQIGKAWEVMMEKDGELAVNSDKRKSDASGLEWQIVSDGSPDGDRHAASLQYFYENLTATEALEQDVTGGTDELIYQVSSALDYRFSVHEMLLRVDNAAAREVTAEFRHTPLWFFEARRGYLGYMPHIFDMYGIPCVQGEWLTAVNIGWMRPLCMAYAMKMFPLRDWLLFCTRYGSGFLDATTDAAVNSEEWTQAQEALQALANDGAVLHNAGVTFKFLEQSARNSLPFHPIVEMINGLYAKCYRGVDLATGSRGSGGGQKSGGGEGGGSKSPVGASVQKEESGIVLIRDAKWLTGVFNERVDRPVIRYLFNQEPRAWFVLMPPLDDTSTQDLAALQGLVPMGFKVMLKEVYKRFRWSVPETGEACLAPAAPVIPPAGPSTSDEETNEDEAPVSQSAPKQKPAGAENIAPSAKKPAAVDAAGEETDPLLKGEEPTAATAPARVPENTPIAPGADPKRNPGLASPGNAYYEQAASRQMPVAMRRGANGTPEVDAAGGLSLAGLQMPALGYSIPNDAAQLETLGKIGLGNTRAAQALRRGISNRKYEISKAVALANAAAEHLAPIHQLATAHADDLDPVRHALAAIEGISDDELFLKKLREFAADHGPMVRLLTDINAYPKSARVLADFTTAKLAEAIKQGPKAALANHNDNHGFHGQFSSDASSGGGGGNYDPHEEQRRGEAAMEKAIKSKTDVFNAMRQKELGDIDFRWGNEKGGIAHVVADHGETTARKIPEILAHGEVSKGPTRAFVEYQGHRLVLANNYFGTPSNHWVISSYDKTK